MDATTFPIPFGWHVTFCILACVFFLIQYVRQKKSYQLLLAVAIPASLCIYIQPTNDSVFYMVGTFELVVLLGAVVFAIVESRHRKEEIADTTPLPKQTENPAESGTSSEE